MVICIFNHQFILNKPIHMKKILLSAMLTLASLSLFAQATNYPQVENSNTSGCTITKVENTDQFTIVSFEEVLRGDSSWARVNKEIFLQTDQNNKHYNFIKAENISIAPVKTYFASTGKNLSFKVYFEKIPQDVKLIDIVERAGANGFFNFYKVNLTRSGSQYDSPQIDRAVTTSNIRLERNFDMAGLDGMNAMAPMLSKLTTSVMDSQLNYYKQPKKVAEIAKVNKQYYNALLKEGFTKAEALKIITSAGLTPKANLDK